MFTNLFVLLKEWLATSTGMATVALIIIIGLILTVLFVVATYNTYMELVQTRKNAVKEATEYKEQIARLEANVADESKRVAGLTEHIDELTARHKLDTADLGEKNFKVCEERDNLSRDLETAILDNKTNSDNIAQLTEELSGERNVNSGLLEKLAHIAFGFRTINSVLGSVVKTKATVLKTYAFNFNSMTSNFESVKLESIEFVDTVAKFLSFNATHVFGATEAIQVHPTQGVSIQNALADSQDSLLSRQGYVSPVFFLQVLYIRSLDLKIILTDFVANPLQVSDENRASVEEFFDWINSPSVIRRSTHTLVLDRSVWESMEDNDVLSLITQSTEKSLYHAVNFLKSDATTLQPLD